MDYTTTMYLGISAEDATNIASGRVFDPGEIMVKITHLTGNSINWSQMTKMTCRIVGGETSENLYVSMIKGITYLNNSANAVTTPGYVILLALGSGRIPSGSYITVQILGNNTEWKSPSSGFVVN
jgi:hypothetical protein